jgi:hypothetical protein
VVRVVPVLFHFQQNVFVVGWLSESCHGKYKKW